MGDREQDLCPRGWLCCDLNLEMHTFLTQPQTNLILTHHQLSHCKWGEVAAQQEVGKVPLPCSSTP